MLIAYAKSGKSVCVACEKQIPKGEIRISIKDFDHAVSAAIGGGVVRFTFRAFFIAYLLSY